MNNLIYVDGRESLEIVKKSLASKKIIALDTEFIKISTLHPIPALIQLYDGDHVFLVDPVALSHEESKEFWDAFNESEALYLIFAMHEDLELVHICSNRIPKHVCDLQLMMCFFGMKYNLGLATTAKELLNIEVIKDQTTSIWLNRPLTSDQIRYAAEDVLHLIDIYNILYPKLQASGLEEQFWSDMDLLKSRISYEDVKFEYLRFVTDDMNTIQRARLRDLVAYRRRVAEDANIPLQFVIANKIMPVLAVRSCRTVNSLGIAGLHWKSVRNYGSEILKVMNNRNISTENLFTGHLSELFWKINCLISNATFILKNWCKEHNVTERACFTKKLIKDWAIWKVSDEKENLPVPLIEMSVWRRKILEEAKVMEMTEIHGVENGGEDQGAIEV